MKYAVVKIGGTQYKVSEGDEIAVEKLSNEEKEKVEFKDVLLLVDGEKAKVGDPLVKGAKIKATVLEQFKGEKIRVATFKAKARYRRVKGFRPQLTKLKIDKILSFRA